MLVEGVAPMRKEETCVFIDGVLSSVWRLKALSSAGGLPPSLPPSLFASSFVSPFSLFLLKALSIAGLDESMAVSEPHRT